MIAWLRAALVSSARLLSPLQACEAGFTFFQKGCYSLCVVGRSAAASLKLSFEYQLLFERVVCGRLNSQLGQAQPNRGACGQLQSKFTCVLH